MSIRTVCVVEGSKQLALIHYLVSVKPSLNIQYILSLLTFAQYQLVSPLKRRCLVQNALEPMEKLYKCRNDKEK